MAIPLIMLVTSKTITSYYIRLTGNQSPSAQLTLLTVYPGATGGIEGVSVGATAWRIKVDNAKYNGLKDCLAAGPGVQVVLWLDDTGTTVVDLTYWNVQLPVTTILRAASEEWTDYVQEAPPEEREYEPEGLAAQAQAQRLQDQKRLQ